MKPLPLTKVMGFSASKKLSNIATDVVFIIKYNSSRKKQDICLCSNRINLIVIKHNKSTQNITLDTDKCALVPHKLKSLHEFRY